MRTDTRASKKTWVHFWPHDAWLGSLTLLPLGVIWSVSAGKQLRLFWELRGYAANDWSWSKAGELQVHMCQRFLSLSTLLVYMSKAVESKEDKTLCCEKPIEVGGACWALLSTCWKPKYYTVRVSNRDEAVQFHMEDGLYYRKRRNSHSMLAAIKESYLHISGINV